MRTAPTAHETKAVTARTGTAMATRLALPRHASGIVAFVLCAVMGSARVSGWQGLAFLACLRATDRFDLSGLRIDDRALALASR